MSEIAKIEIHNLTFEIYVRENDIIAHNKLLNLEFMGINNKTIGIFSKPETYNNYEVVKPMRYFNENLKESMNLFYDYEEIKKEILQKKNKNKIINLIDHVEEDKPEQNNLTLIDFYCGEPKRKQEKEDNEVLLGFIKIKCGDAEITLTSTLRKINGYERVKNTIILIYINYDLHIAINNYIYNTRTKLKIYFDENTRICDYLRKFKYININWNIIRAYDDFVREYHLKIVKLLDNNRLEEINIKSLLYEVL
jgi:hypothetical protein